MRPVGCWNILLLLFVSLKYCAFAMERNSNHFQKASVQVSDDVRPDAHFAEAIMMERKEGKVWAMILISELLSCGRDYQNAICRERLFRNLYKFKSS